MKNLHQKKLEVIQNYGELLEFKKIKNIWVLKQTENLNYHRDNMNDTDIAKNMFDESQ